MGVGFWDTANVYQGGSSEEFVGRAIHRYSRREDIVVATKVHGKTHDGPGGSGLSHKAILEQLDASLRRLGTDYVDVYYLHRFDDQMPVEENMQALHDVVKAGKVRYLGVSSMWAWQFAKLQHIAALNGWRRFSAMEEPVQRPQAGGGARDDSVLPRPGRRPDRTPRRTATGGDGRTDPSVQRLVSTGSTNVRISASPDRSEFQS